MSLADSLSDIGVKVTEQSTGIAQAVMHELVNYLDLLASSGEVNAIDLRSLPMNEADRDELSTLLGKGEVDITLNTIGSSRIIETSFNGIWWITHYGEDNKVVSELLEVTTMPDIVRSQKDDVFDALERIRQVSN